MHGRDLSQWNPAQPPDKHGVQLPTIPELTAARQLFVFRMTHTFQNGDPFLDLAARSLDESFRCAIQSILESGLSIIAANDLFNPQP